MILLLGSLAFATSGFDPSTPAQRYEGDETWTQEGDVKIWAAVERWQDPDRTLFQQEEFNAALSWKDSTASPWIRTCFASSTPHSSAFLLHVGIHEPTAEGTPILFVHGAGDNGTRSWVTMGTRMDKANRPVYAVTFAHPHGDVFQQAEIVADAIAVIKARTGSDQVDVVAHSKGGVAAFVYAANGTGANWGDAAYASKGTAYRGDIRRLVLIATPLMGVDTSYRWTGPNLLQLDPAVAIAPTSWSTYYPYSTSNPYVTDDLTAQDFHPEDGDYFPGQRQLLARQDHDLPGSLTWLGGYSLQPDWYTTYEGGYGYYSYSQGIDAAIEDGGNLIAKMASRGVEPGIEVFLLAGTNPLMPNGDEAYAELWKDVATEEEWQQLIDDIDAHGTPLTANEDELDGLEKGWLVLGEVTGPSDGVVFTESALAEAVVAKRGATVVETYAPNLSHLDLLYASPITGQMLIDAGNSNPAEDGWMRAVGQRYIDADTLGWVERVLADEAPVDTDTGEDTDLPDDTDTGGPDDTDPAGDGGERETQPRPCGGCDLSRGGGRLASHPAVLFAILAVLTLTRRKTQ